jgi:hypothetical protein
MSYGPGQTRRDALRRGAAWTGAVTLGAAAGSLLAAGEAISEAEDESQVLRGVLDVEQTITVCYTAALGTGLLKPGVAASARHFQSQEREHAAAIKAALDKLGAGDLPAPPRPQQIKGLDGARTQNDVLAFLLEQETMVVAAYFDAQQKVEDGKLRQTLSTIMPNEGQHLVVIRQALAKQSVPNAQETGEAS